MGYAIPRDIRYQSPMPLSLLERGIVLGFFQNAGTKGLNEREVAAIPGFSKRARIVIRQLRREGWITRAHAQGRFAVTPDQIDETLR